MEILSHVYILVDEQNRVTRIEGEYSLPSDLTGWILVEEGTPCDRLNLAQNNYLPKPIFEEHGVYRYKWTDEIEYSMNPETGEEEPLPQEWHIAERTEEEIQADIDAIPPSPPTIDERVDSLSEEITSVELAIAETYEESSENLSLTSEEITSIEIAIAEIYEELLLNKEVE